MACKGDLEAAAEDVWRQIELYKAELIAEIASAVVKSKSDDKE